MIRASLLYWAMIFGLGFVLGTGRVLWLEPALGPVAATLVELPVMLGASALAARWILRRFPPGNRGRALAIGLIAFALLLASELLLSLALGRTAADWAAGLATPAGALGLAGQVGFALLPALLYRPSR